MSAIVHLKNSTTQREKKILLLCPCQETGWQGAIYVLLSLWVGQALTRALNSYRHPPGNPFQL